MTTEEIYPVISLEERLINFLLVALCKQSSEIITIDGWEEYFKVCPQDRTPDKILEMLLEAVRERGYNHGFYDGYNSRETTTYNLQ